LSSQELNIEKIIKKAVKEGIAAGYSVKQQEVKNYYKQTEKRLYSYPNLKLGINAYQDEIKSLKKYGLPGKSKSIVYMPSGSRLDRDDLLEARIQDLCYKIQCNKDEIKEIDEALKLIKDDAWYKVIEYKYFQGHKDNEIAEILTCDESTVRRNKKRLVNKIVVRLYGAAALY
jgi:DNA-directed RNA polymerase specialized sigma subunit